MRQHSKCKPKFSPSMLTDQHLSTLSEPELLALVMAEYWQSHPSESPVKSLAAMLKCSEQHLYNCLPTGRDGHIGMEAWIEIELHTGTQLVSRWWHLKRRGMKNE